MEKEFRGAMELFQSGRHHEAASRFALIAKKNPQHLLASHALYWAGEAGARAQQWSTATENWEELEAKYPRSAYMPEALAGLSRAYEQQGNTGKARAYRETLVRAFPKSPVAMSLKGGEASPVSTSPPSATPEASAPEFHGEDSEKEDSSDDSGAEE
jgi:TolA-binding protein